MADTVVITLFRHGLTLGNKEKRYMGWNDSPLCEEAKLSLSTYELNRSSYDYFVSSDIQRCLTTMNLLFPDVETIALSDFREMDFGVFQGKTYEELKDVKEYQLWINNNKTHSPPEGESFDMFTERIQSGWEKLVNKMIQEGFRSSFLVTHGGVIRYLLTQFAPVQRDYWDWNISHGTGYELTFELDRLRRGDRCTLLREVPLMENETG